MKTAEQENTLDALITTVKERVSKIQQFKKSSVWKWILGGCLALAVLVTLGVVYYLIKRRSKELADMRTGLEQQKVLLEQKKHEAAHEQYHAKKQMLEQDVLQLSNYVRDQSLKLKLLEAAHDKRRQELEKIHVWKDLNDA